MNKLPVLHKKYVLYLAMAMVVLAVLAVWLLRARPAVQTASVARGPAVEAVYATGTVEPVRWAKVGPQVTGRITDILAKEGDRVARGAVLARLDDREARANVKQLLAREEFLRDEEERRKKLFDKQLISRQDYEKAVSDHAQALESLNATRQTLADLTLTSPLMGKVLRQDGQVGEVVTSASVLFWVGQSDRLWVVAEVDEEDILRIRPRQRVLIKADAFAGQALEGEVTEITPKGDPINKTYRVRVGLPANTPLKIGMTTEVNILVREERDALLAPVSALIDGHLWIVRDSRAYRQEVRIGVVGDQRVQILSGVAEGDTVVLYPPATLKDSQHVRVSGP
ncbi:MAG: efflux RND transporter periplasmic adaptor subunit [Sulfuricaulis sp.]|nr:efflux RND transporter periplasmic adaptor subunit [Sulfuricaulis sp.]